MTQIYLFLDYANVTVMAQKCAGIKYKFPKGISDRTIKVTPNKVYDFIKFQESNKSSLEMFYYTTDRSLSTEDIGGRKITAMTLKISSYDKREKAVDTNLVADAVDIITQCKNIDPIIQLWSGDADVIKPISAKARKYGCKIEIWSFKASLTENAGNSRENDVKIEYLDDIFEQFTERKTSWSPRAAGELPSPTSSFKLRFSRDCPGWEKAMGKDSSSNWREIVNLLTQKVELPLKGYRKDDEWTLILVLDVPPTLATGFLQKIHQNATVIQQYLRNWFEMKCNIQCDCRIDIGDAAEMLQRMSMQPPPHPQHNGGRGMIGRGRGEFRQPHPGQGRGFPRGRPFVRSP